MSHSKEPTGVYSKKEMWFMSTCHNCKNFLFSPLLKVLTALHITANMLTVASGIATPTFLIVAIFLQEPLYFVVGVWVHMLIDGIDGTLARYQDKQSMIGSLQDVISDHIGIISCGIYLIWNGVANPILVMLYVILYTIIIYNAFVLWILKKSYSFLLRPRLIVYAALTIDFLWRMHSTNITIIILLVPLLFSSVEGLVKLIKHLQQCNP